MNAHYTYLLILGCALVFPASLSFDRKVAFHRQWKYVFGALLLPAAFYLVWDVWFTSINVWSFNAAYVLNVRLLNLPVEEVLFFFVVPYCCTFIYACIRAYFPRLTSTPATEAILFFIGVAVFVASLVFHRFHYTFYTGMFLSAFIFLLFLFRQRVKSFNTAAFLLSFTLILLPFLVINGFLTALPVVIYNDRANLAFRIATIPVEDVFYGMLLVLMNIVMFDKLRSPES